MCGKFTQHSTGREVHAFKVVSGEEAPLLFPSPNNPKKPLSDMTDLGQRERRIDFIKRCNPLWLLDHVYVRKQEIKRFLWERYYSASPDELQFATSSLAVLESIYAGARVRLDLTIEKLVSELNTPELREARKLSQKSSPGLRLPRPSTEAK